MRKRAAIRVAGWVLLAGFAVASAAAFAQEPPATGQGAIDARTQAAREAADEKQAAEDARLMGWKWANFVVLAGAIGYMAAKHGPAFFAARSRQIRKDIIEAGDARKEADERAAAVDYKLANLGADIARLREESASEREAETQQLLRHRETERAKIHSHAEREIESAGKAARLELKRYAADLAIALAERKIRERMSAAVQDLLVRGFVHDLESPDAPTGAGANAS